MAARHTPPSSFNPLRLPSSLPSPSMAAAAAGSPFLSKKLSSRGHWRPSEDAKLKEIVAVHGPHNWNSIAEKLPGRSGKSCRLRWFNQLDPRINRRAFSDEEEERLLAAHRLYGNKWSLIARLFPGRTDNAVKNHWHVVMARRSRAAVKNVPCSGGESTGSRDDCATSSCTALSLSLLGSTATDEEEEKVTAMAARDRFCTAAGSTISPDQDHQQHASGLPFFDFLGVGAS